MKLCPECRRDYYDDTLLYCLDDGNALLEGPASGQSEPPASAGGQFGDEPQTAILNETVQRGEAPTRAQIHTTEQTAVFPRGAEAEPRESQGGRSEKRSFSANRAAKPLIVAAVVVAVLVGGFLAYRYFSTSSSRQIESIAVMPFVNESGNADVEYLSDGMTESLMSSLAQVPGLSVKARSSVSRYLEKDAQTVGRELGVQAVLSGRIVKSGEDMSVFLELVDARTGDRLWGERYVRPMAGLVELQNDIARDVSQKLSTRLTGAEQQKITKNYTENAEAYRLYLQGRFFWNKRTAEGLRTAISHFEQAVSIDPNYALAYTGLADSYALLAMYGGKVPPTESMPKAKEYARKALALDPNLAEAHASLAQILDNFDYDFAGAERELIRAIELNPSYATAHQWLAEVHAHTGSFDKSMAAIDKALELDPFSLIINRMKGMILLYARRYDEALEQMNRTVALDAGFPGVYHDIFVVHQIRRDHDKAIEAYVRWQELGGDAVGGQRGRTSYAKGGWKAFLLDSTSREGDFRRRYPVRVATFYVELGDHDAALDQLQAAYDLRVNDTNWIKVDPRLDPLRGDPRFQALMKKIGFPE
jgi:TolB-like protein/Tfp pilus assembly protein PilF